MTTLQMSALPALPVMRTTPEWAQNTAIEVRAALANVREAREWSERGSYAQWEGDASVAAGHAQTTFTVELDVAEAVMEKVATAADTLEDELIDLQERRSQLDSTLGELRQAQTALSARTATTPEEVTALEGDVRRHNGFVGTLVLDVTTWEEDVEEAEAAFVAALESVDTVTEGNAAADDPDRVDADGLAGGLQRAASPQAARDYWDSLSPAQQQALINNRPELVGRTDGVPVWARDDANRSLLQRDLDYYATREEDGQLSPTEERYQENAEKLRDAMADHADDYDPVTGEHVLNLIGYDARAFDGDGSVIVSLGDPDRADHVSTYVPGTTTTLSGIGGSVDNIAGLHENATNQDGSVATMLWLDYDAPSFEQKEIGDIATVASPFDASGAGRHLSDFVEGLRASREDPSDPSHYTLIGHSYGATTSSWAALHADDGEIDDLVLLGSPGAPTPTADMLTDANVYVGASDYDPISLLGQGSRPEVGLTPLGGLLANLPAVHGVDPAQSFFGAERIEVDQGSYRVEDLFHNHSSYFGGSSLDNISSVVTGGDPTTVDGRNPGNYQTLPELVEGSTAASGLERARDGAIWLGDQAAEGARRTYETGREVAEGAYDTGRDLAEGAYDTGRDLAEGAYDTGRDLAEGAYDTGRDAADGLVSSGRDVAEGLWSLVDR